MGVATGEFEVPSAVPVDKMFQAAVVDADKLFPKIMPQGIKSAELVEGDGGAGSIRMVNLVEGDFYMKHKVDALDKESFVYNYTIIEGDTLTGKFEKIVYETKWVSSPDGGSIFKATVSFHTLPGFDVPAEKLVNTAKEKATVMVKAVEAYLLAN
ncbi:major strawberry allergen Fra a 1-2-like isoform X2 [Mangifera indica]|uniref:major strawberry allergen Fra a 1-2-like isoform X1 n=1 Tax=Mangifera indica TaxID=29780 RepID=UPI001CFB3C74|nr:major strawberry allergen Fra a 1-2-like isoform X1 [Mangifera indica]XP_044498124.1 major strawberry allergen Fra a 1-2-like isoform X2 [Mangifera indica]